MTTSASFAEFDAHATGVHVGWVEFDAQAGGNVFVGWAEFDAASDNGQPIPAFPGFGGGGIGARTNWGRLPSYYDSVEKKYNIPVQNVDESEEEEIVMKILMEIARHEL